MPRGLSPDHLRLVVISGSNPTSYGYLCTHLPPGSQALDLFIPNSLFGLDYLDLDGDEREWRRLSPEDLAAKIVRVTKFGWEYLRYQGLVVEAGPGEGDGANTTRFPPDIPPVLATVLHRITVNPERGRIFRLSEGMATLKELHPNYNMQKRTMFKEKMKTLLNIYRR